MIRGLLEKVHTVDAAAFRWCAQRAASERFARAARAISWMGNGHLYVLAGLVAFVLDGGHGANFFFVGLLAYAIELPSYMVLKNAIRRRRPRDTLGEINTYLEPADTFSFPSGHAAAAFLFATMVLYYYPVFAAPAFAFATLVGAVRVALGVHYPLDIFAGGALGAASAAIALLVLA